MDYTCENTIIENMRDFGCDEQTIQKFLIKHRECDLQAQKQILNEYRERILEKLHREQKNIDLLDFMLYQLEKCYCNYLK